jgi:hypothetical protein
VLQNRLQQRAVGPIEAGQDRERARGKVARELGRAGEGRGEAQRKQQFGKGQLDLRARAPVFGGGEGIAPLRDNRVPGLGGQVAPRGAAGQLRQDRLRGRGRCVRPRAFGAACSPGARREGVVESGRLAPRCEALVMRAQAFDGAIRKRRPCRALGTVPEKGRCSSAGDPDPAVRNGQGDPDPEGPGIRSVRVEAGARQAARSAASASRRRRISGSVSAV